MATQRHPGGHPAQCEFWALQRREDQPNRIALHPPVFDPTGQTSPSQVCLDTKRSSGSNNFVELLKNDAASRNFKSRNWMALLEELGSNLVAVQEVTAGWNQ
jgi:hypothetical protein